jgi:hypothetical protein
MLGLQESRRITAYQLMGYVDNFPDKEEIRQEFNNNPLKISPEREIKCVLFTIEVLQKGFLILK